MKVTMIMSRSDLILYILEVDTRELEDMGIYVHILNFMFYQTRV